MSVDKAKLESIGRELLLAIGEDPSREGLVETPARWARWWAEFIDHDAGNGKAFEVVKTDQLIAVSGIRVWSLCEHHLLPFSCDLAVGYIAQNRIAGLSKLARACQRAAHRLQVQERLVEQVADEVQALTGTQDVAVVGKGNHLCMVMRGVRTPGEMHTSVMRGRFLELGPARQEFFSLVEGGRNGA